NAPRGRAARGRLRPRRCARRAPHHQRGAPDTCREDRGRPRWCRGRRTRGATCVAFTTQEPQIDQMNGDYSKIEPPRRRDRREKQEHDRPVYPIPTLALPLKRREGFMRPDSTVLVSASIRVRFLSFSAGSASLRFNLHFGFLGVLGVLAVQFCPCLAF